MSAAREMNPSAPAIRPAVSWSWPSVGEICSTDDTCSDTGSEPYFSTLASALASSAVKEPVISALPPMMASLT